MAITIILPDGATYVPERKDEPMTNAMNLANHVDQQASQAAATIPHTGQQPRTVAVVAAELQYAMDYGARVPALRAELDALLGRKPRTRKVAP